MSLHDDARDRRAEAVEELARANSASNDTMVRLIEHVRKDTVAQNSKIEALNRQQRTLRILLGVIGVLTLLVLLIAMYNVYNVTATRQTAKNMTDIGAQVAQTNETLLDCLNSAGRCGQINAAQQRAILDEVKKYELTGFYCIRTNPQTKDPDGEDFLKCMQRLYPGGPLLQER